MSAATPHIRDAEPEDMDRIFEIEQEAFPDPYPMGLLKAFIYMPGAYVVAVFDGVVVGYAIGMIRWNTVGHIVSVAVDEKMRRKGVGEALIHKLIDRLANQGIKKFRLEVRVSNAAAISLYKKLGFEEKGKMERYYADGESAELMYFNVKPCPQK